MNLITKQHSDQTVTVNIQALRTACTLDLEKLASTCCLANRSERMRTLNQRFAVLASGFAESTKPENIDASLTAVEKFGEAIGGLFATCCTPTREKLYIQLMKNINGIHTHLWTLKGVNHS